MKSVWMLYLTTFSCLIWHMVATSTNGWAAGSRPKSAEIIKLSQPRSEGSLPVETALSKRRSVREYKKEPLTLADVGQLAWAAQGITHPAGLRTAPSAGALYPLELYVLSAMWTVCPPASTGTDPPHTTLSKRWTGTGVPSCAA